jgi:hypothetical protein
VFAKELGLESLQAEATAQFLCCSRNEALHCPRIPIIKYLYEKSITDSEIKQQVIDRLLEIFLDPAFGDHKFIGDALCCNVAFSQDFSTALKAHHQIKYPLNCMVRSNRGACSVHFIGRDAAPTPKKPARKRASPTSGGKGEKKAKTDDKVTSDAED